jgi:hypothetical protein
VPIKMEKVCENKQGILTAKVAPEPLVRQSVYKYAVFEYRLSEEDSGLVNKELAVWKAYLLFKDVKALVEYFESNKDQLPGLQYVVHQGEFVVDEV